MEVKININLVEEVKKVVAMYEEGLITKDEAEDKISFASISWLSNNQTYQTIGG